MVAPVAMGNRSISLGWPLAVTSVVAVGLFIDSLFSRRDDLSNLSLWMVRESVGIGPRLLVEAVRRAARAVQLARVDVEVSAGVLSWLADRKGAASREEVLAAFPGLDWGKLRRDLRLVDGVLFLRTDASRVTLSQPVRYFLRGLGRRGRSMVEEPPRTAPPPPEPEPVHHPERLSPYEILGVRPGATRAELKTAYRARMKECHPDRFAGMDETARALSEEWTKAINAAYAELSGHGARTPQ